MIGVVLISGYVQQWQIQGRSQNQQSQNPQQQMIMKILPAFIGVISFGLPGALVLYFVTSNLFRVGQQWVITRTIYSDEAVAAGVIETSSEEKADKATPSDTAKKAIGPSENGKAAGTKGKATPPRNAPDGPRQGQGQQQAHVLGARRHHTVAAPAPSPQEEEVDPWSGYRRPARRSTRQRNERSTSSASTTVMRSSKCSRSPAAGSSASPGPRPGYGPG